MYVYVKGARAIATVILCTCITQKVVRDVNVYVEGVRLKDKDKDKDKDSFIGPQEFVVGYSKAPEQPQSSARPICHSHAMTRTGARTSHHMHCCIWSSPRYALRHGHCNCTCITQRLYGTCMYVCMKSEISLTWLAIIFPNMHLSLRNPARGLALSGHINQSML